ncbi:Skp1-protein-hydroxyproline N-acetylglucosaminyltransferase [Hondaea fermentalgiana]|uniref:Skp1-protein-hydroxyproline N-acetylglucosaminyltransferase n=1 Tax=Hondaea fermentalgiana TaxID=2315210 RepID=A0A2R5GHT5_9STRA|nr:Skp1-protein-hydroxyproline N-acetylglucosaminyltransferase [Hondaea fermentalgiana]|eukprot:GBG29899.1 Skp1-protein-hydroxyproline N-acetylglucosaminyltransferase [Hondaea fermentalgiana]
MWHVGGGDIYALKDRLAGLREQYSPDWEAAAVATDEPALKGKDVAPPLGAFAEPKPNKPGNVRGSASLPTDEAKEESQAIESDFVWQDVSRQVSFVLVDPKDSAWAEVSADGEAKFRFLEVRREDRLVELHDSNRELTVLLLEQNSLFKFRDENFRDLYVGFWDRWEGKQFGPVLGAYTDERRPPKPVLELKDAPLQTIVVMLAAFRDPLCGNTLFEAFSNARYPERVSAIVVEQKADDDVYDCVEEYCALVKKNGGTDADCRRQSVRVDKVPLDRARGVMPARYRQNLLLEDEEFCLQIDSHSAFEAEWDQIAIEDWLLTENEMAVITAYPNMVRDRHDQRNSPQRCSTKFSGDHEVVHGGNSAVNVHPGRTPYLIPFFGAGTSFSKCHANFNVPYDPYMSYLFGGEEFNRAARLFTSGYDMYGPKRNFVYHYYDSDEKPPQGRMPRHREFASLSTQTKKLLGSQTTARWRTLLGLPLTKKNPNLSVAAMQDAARFGLGTRRRIEQYEAFSRVNLHAATTESRCKDLGNIKWQSYDYESPFYPAGRDCPYHTMADIRRHCCTTLQSVLASTTAFLDKTNEVIAAEVQLSPPAFLSQPSQPILTSSNNGASFGACGPDSKSWPSQASMAEKAMSKGEMSRPNDGADSGKSRTFNDDKTGKEQGYHDDVEDQDEDEEDQGEGRSDEGVDDDEEEEEEEVKGGDGEHDDDDDDNDDDEDQDDEDQAEIEEEEREDAEDAAASGALLDVDVSEQDALDDSS